MKIKDGFVLREVAGNTVVVPLGNEHTFSNMLKLNETGKLLWERLTKGATLEELCSLLVEEYEVDETTAKADAERFVSTLQKWNIIE